MSTEFIALPAGWFNYYEDKGKIFRSPCPGVIKNTADDGEVEFEFAEIESGKYLSEVSRSKSHLGCYFGDMENDRKEYTPLDKRR